MTGWTAAYQELELEVQEAMRELCGAACAACRRPCCKEVFCREGRDSPFLALVREGVETPGYDPRRGWLGPRGCRLPVGRPPVCYAYVCPEILSRLPGPDHRYAANILGDLVARAGERAAADRHAVELEATALAELRPAQILGRVARLRAALGACRRVLAGADAAVEGLEELDDEGDRAPLATPFPGGASAA